MAPAATPVETAQVLPSVPVSKTSIAAGGKRMLSSGALDSFSTTDLTPVIGTEFDEIDVVDDILNAPNKEQRIRDLAILIAERGVVFFRKQDKLTNDLQKQLILQLGALTARPAGNSLHVHPVLNDTREFGGDDAEISTISSVQRSTLYRDSDYTRMAAVWHSDISFEKQPADYTSLRLTQLPRTGGDTLWASGYELYDRMSKPFQEFCEGLTASHVGSVFMRMAATDKFELHTAPRGSPLNSGSDLSAHHPVIRTNPLTGWKSVFPVGSFPVAIDGLTRRESDNLLEYFHDLLTYGHDLQVRFKWRNENDLAIWDNRSAFHSATNDFTGFGERFGCRAVGVGETPYYDPESRSRREELGTTDDLHICHR